jgi:hypothetical protein
MKYIIEIDIVEEQFNLFPVSAIKISDSVPVRRSTRRQSIKDVKTHLTVIAGAKRLKNLDVENAFTVIS